jgi:hypothetical protein
MGTEHRAQRGPSRFSAHPSRPPIQCLARIHRKNTGSVKVSLALARHHPGSARILAAEVSRSLLVQSKAK